MRREARTKHTTSIMGIVVGALGQRKLRTAVTACTIVASIALEVVPPLVLGAAVDELTQHQAIPLALAAGYFALLACSGLADALREALIVALGESITHALRTATMRKQRHLPASYFTSHEAGKIASLHVNDVDAIEDLFSSGIVSMVSDLGTVVGIMVVVFTRSVGLGILLLVALPLLFAFTVHMQRRTLAAHTRNRRATAQANGILPETLHDLRSIRVYHAERFAERRYDGAIQHSFQALETTNFYDAVYSPVIITVSAVVIAIMMSLSGQSGAFRDLFGMTVGTAVALISYVGSIFTPLASIGMEIQTVQAAAAGWNRVQEFLDEPEMTEDEPKQTDIDSERPEPCLATDSQPKAGQGPEADRRPEPSARRATGQRAAAGERSEAGLRLGEEQNPSAEQLRGLDVQPAISVRDVSFSYDGVHPVLEHFSLEVGEGEFVTLMGRTGAGKSTLFKLLLGLYEPQQGSIVVGGLRPQELGTTDRRRLICCVEQKLVAVPGTMRDQITLGNAVFSDSEVWQALETVGLKGAVAAFPQQLDTPYQESLFSQGQKQLLMIARAIVSNPRILLLDEITAGLDSATEQVVTEALVKASARRTVLSISHRLSEVVTGRIVNIEDC